MKLEHLLIQYFYTSKELSLQGIGKFLLSQDLVLPPDTEKEVVMPENAIGFEFNIKATEDEGLISYIVENTKKIRPLASADLDSFLTLGKQFLNIGKPFKISNLEVVQKDFPNVMNWNDAKEACTELGDGWRLPTKDELNQLYNKKNKIDCFKNYSYWSSTEQVTDNGYPGAWFQEFTGRQTYSAIEYATYFRAVRTI